MTNELRSTQEDGPLSDRELSSGRISRRKWTVGVMFPTFGLRHLFVNRHWLLRHPPRCHRNLLHGLYVLLLACVVGCGDSSKATVRGTLTIDNQLVTNGIITFVPQEDGAVAASPLDESGKFSLQVGSNTTIDPGVYDVAIVAIEGSGGLPTADNPNPQTRLISPVHYGDSKTSGLEYQVEPGVNEFDIKLKSDG